MSPTRSRFPICPLVTSASDVKNFSGIDDFAQPAQRQSARHLHGCQESHHSGRAGRAGPGRLRGRRIPRRPPGGPVRYMPSVNGVTDTGLLAHPHGIDDPPGPGPRRHGRLRRSAQPCDGAVGRQRDRRSGHHGTVLEAVGSQGRSDVDLAAARRQGPRGPVHQQRARRGHVRSAHAPAQAQGRLRRDHGRRLDLVCAGRHRAQSGVSPGLSGRPGRIRRRVHHHPG